MLHIAADYSVHMHSRDCVRCCMTQNPSNATCDSLRANFTCLLQLWRCAVGGHRQPSLLLDVLGLVCCVHKPALGEARGAERCCMCSCIDAKMTDQKVLYSCLCAWLIRHCTAARKRVNQMSQRCTPKNSKTISAFKATARSAARGVLCAAIRSSPRSSI